ncbi:13726_t:CDS:2 [Acaulospora colombiana]|uniref:13726_t:CDS:1 n=1 Tax=Acaulospora colombiana TaxID=27376 RepID=A0ACA9PK12_9GLOM|nr:13726_t:CDS:2 [Acaulospora colombiana]
MPLPQKMERNTDTDKNVDYCTFHALVRYQDQGRSELGIYLTGLILCRPAPEIFQTNLVIQNNEQAIPTGSIAKKLEAGGRIPYIPPPYQKRIVGKSSKNKVMIKNAGRAGKKVESPLSMEPHQERKRERDPSLARVARSMGEQNGKAQRGVESQARALQTSFGGLITRAVEYIQRNICEECSGQDFANRSTHNESINDRRLYEGAPLDDAA